MPSVQFTGLASGIDSKSIIDSLMNLRSQPNVFRRATIDFIESENSALDEVETKLNTLRDLLQKLRVVNGGGLKKKASSSNSDFVTASADSTASNSSLSVNVTALADTATQSLYRGAGYASLSDKLSATVVGTETVAIDVGTGADRVTVSVDVTSSTTVGEFLDAVNGSSNASGRLSAAAVNTGSSSSPTYQVVLSTLQSGTAKGELSVALGGIGDVTKSAIAQATDATFTISGITGNIKRASNTVSDVVPGITLQLVAEGAANILVSEDSSSTSELMQQIVTAFNDLASYVNKNNTVTQKKDGSIVYGTLAKSQLDDQLMADLRSGLAAALAPNGTEVTKAAQIGISTNRDGTITFDADDFSDAVAKDPLGVNEVINDIGDRLAGPTGVIYQYTRYQGLIDIAKNSNKSEIELLDEKIAQLDRSNEKTRTTLEMQYARLESTMAGLQNQQAALTNIINSIG